MLNGFMFFVGFEGVTTIWLKSKLCGNIQANWEIAMLQKSSFATGAVEKGLYYITFNLMSSANKKCHQKIIKFLVTRIAQIFVVIHL